MVRAMSDTPLSDLMAQHSSINSAESHKRFFEAFRQSKVGIVATGAPDGTVGQVTSTTASPLGVGVTRTPDGRRRILVFADPSAFIQRFGRRFNADMDGQAVLMTAAFPLCPLRPLWLNPFVHLTQNALPGNIAAEIQQVEFTHD